MTKLSQGKTYLCAMKKHEHFNLSANFPDNLKAPDKKGL